MKKHKNFLLFVFLALSLILCLPTASHALTAEEVTEGKLEDFREVLPNDLSHLADSPEALTEAVGLRAILADIISAVKGEGGEAVSLFLTALGISLLLSLASSTQTISEVAEAAAGCVGVGILFDKLYPAIDHAARSLSEASVFFGTVIPILTGINAASGSVGTAGAQVATMSLTLSVISGVCVRLLLPISVFGAALGLLGSLGDGGAATLGVGVRNLFLWLTGIGSTLVTGAMALQTLITSSADTAALRAAKYGAASLLPIVGGTVSSTLSTLAAGVAYLKSTVGVASVAVLLSVLLSPLVTLLLYRGAVSLAITVSGFFGGGASLRMLTSLRAALDTVAAVFTLCSAVYIIQLVLFMKGGAQV